MATPRKTAQGTWRIQIDVRSTRDSGTFPTARDAREWAAQRTAEIRALAKGKGGAVKTLEDALRRYMLEVTPDKRGWAKESIRLKAFLGSDAHAKLPRRRKLDDIQATDLAAWRDARLRLNSRGAVLRDMTLLGAVLETARADWGWLERNPMQEVRRPAEPDHRERLVTGAELAAMLDQLGYADGAPVRSVSQAVAVCALAALETGMRAGELCGLTWTRVHGTYVRLDVTKNGKAREVALTPRAQELLERMRGWDAVLVFGLKSQSLDALWRKARGRAKLSGFTFHDLRHTAATRLAQRLHVLDLCRMFGWTNPKMAMRYYNTSAAEIAARLAA